MLVDQDREVEDVTQDRGRQDLSRGTTGNQSSFLEEHYPVSKLRREIEIMGDDQRSDPLTVRHLPDKPEHRDLMGEIGIGGWFIEQKPVGLLGQRPREADPLPFSSRELIDSTLGKLECIGLAK